MRRGNISRDAVLRTIEEYDRRGPAAFRAHYGYGPARDYFLVHEGRRYDSKAVAGVAHRHTEGRPLNPDEFSGGRAAAVHWLRRLGFQVSSPQRPDWTRDELLLLCALLDANGWRPAPADDPAVAELSALLTALPLPPDTLRDERLRSPAAVASAGRALAATAADVAPGTGTGATLEQQVVRAFRDSPLELAAAAELLRTGLRTGAFVELPPDEPGSDEYETPEGRLLLRTHLTRERDRGLRRRKIAAVLAAGRPLACEVCDFDFATVYGERGEGYIECHHVVPLHLADESTTRLADLALICANCHRMIHRRAPWPTPAELRARITR
ncbi:HNH endonuclease [Kitasatospora sp. NPDC088134]|uniref:HNH endonuclease n=1 Tax=Kitasatospora sp. NPDC088134 TaxID=3364071 RepID=UPI0037F7E8D4